MIPGLGSSLVYAASDGRHRPASHPVLGAVRAPAPPQFDGWDGWQIAALRIRHRLTQRELGALIGVSAAAVSMWESDATVPSADHMARLREILT